MSISYIENSIDEIAKLYDLFLVPNFNEDELKPLGIILRLVERNCYKVLSLTEEGETVAVAFIVFNESKDASLLDYFAVKDDFRSKGYGSMLLKYLGTNFASDYPMIIETEALLNDSDDDIKTKRNNFYIKNGANRTTFKALIFGCLYDIWYASDKTYSDEYIVKKYEEIYKFMIPLKMFEDNCVIPMVLP